MYAFRKLKGLPAGAGENDLLMPSGDPLAVNVKPEQQQEPWDKEQK